MDRDRQACPSRTHFAPRKRGDSSNCRARVRALLAASSLAVAAASFAQSPEPLLSRSRTEDAEFVEATAADLLMDVELGRLAARRATRLPLRELGQAIEGASLRSHVELKAIAAQKKLELPVEPRPEQKTTIAELATMSGKAFDDAFLRAMAGARAEALDLYTREADSWGDPDVKAWAEKTIPVLKEHQARVKQLAEPPATASAPLP